MPGTGLFAFYRRLSHRFSLPSVANIRISDAPRAVAQSRPHGEGIYTSRLFRRHIDGVALLPADAYDDGDICPGSNAGGHYYIDLIDPHTATG